MLDTRNAPPKDPGEHPAEDVPTGAFAEQAVETESSVA